MKKLYTFTSDDIHTTTDFANGERNTVNLEDAELLPPGARVLTYEQVLAAVEKSLPMFTQIYVDTLKDTLFGDKE